MWPTLFASGLVWSILVAASLACFTASVVGFVFLIIVKPSRQYSDISDGP